MAKEKKPLEKHSVTIKFGHLNPVLQDLIGKPGSGNLGRAILPYNISTIRDERKARVFFEGATLLMLLTAISAPDAPGVRKEIIRPIYGAFSVLESLVRQQTALCIQKKHRGLVTKMGKFGILRTRFEGDYPKGWISPTVVAGTHPTFYIKMNGDLVFPKMTRTEYARYIFQRGWAGKLGLNAWRWRAYIKPPKAPKKIRDWAKEKAAEWTAALRRPKPFLEPALGMAKTARLKRLNRRRTL